MINNVRLSTDNTFSDINVEERIIAAKAILKYNKIPAIMADDVIEKLLLFDLYNIRYISNDTILYANGEHMQEIWRVFRMFLPPYFSGEEPRFNKKRIYSLNIEDVWYLQINVVKMFIFDENFEDKQKEVFVNLCSPSREDMKLLKRHPILGYYFGGKKFLRKVRHSIAKDLVSYVDDMDDRITKIYDDPEFCDDSYKEIYSIVGETDMNCRRLENMFYKKLNSLIEYGYYYDY